MRAADGMGDWEVVDKRVKETVKNKRLADSSDDGSDLSD